MQEYESDYDWLMRVTQEDLIEDLRSKGRRQAATRQLRNKQASTGGKGSGRPDSASGAAAASGGEGTAAQGATQFAQLEEEQRTVRAKVCDCEFVCCSLCWSA